MYGGYTMAGEAKASSFGYVVPNASAFPGALILNGSLPTLQAGTAARYCSRQDNIPAVITHAEQCPEGLRTWQMTCFVAGELQQLAQSGQPLFGFHVNVLQALQVAAPLGCCDGDGSGPSSGLGECRKKGESEFDG